jgi:hypothetical protein
MSRALLLSIVSAWLAAAPPAPAPAAAPSASNAAPFVLGVLRRDGLVLPFAEYDGRGWGTAWPRELRGQEIPIALEDVPEGWWGKAGPQGSLTRWVEGRRAGTVALQRPTVVPIMCGARLWLRSDYTAAELVPPPFEQPQPKDGLVVSGDRTIEPLPAVARGSDDWNSSAVALLGAFDKAEEAAARQYMEWRHPVPRQQRQRVPIEIEALYRVPMEEEGWTAYYVEAVRKYPPGPDDKGCGLVTFASGWIRLGPKGRPEFDLGARVTYCDRRGAGYMLPLGLMTVDAKRFWIYQISGYDREWYVVARPTRRAIELHVEYAAGLCPR